MSAKSIDRLSTTAIFVVVAAVYLPALRVGFLSDDYGFSVLYSMSGHEILRCLEMVHTKELILSPIRPTAMLSLWIDYIIYGWHPFGFHLTNIILHAINASLVWRLLKSLKLPNLAATASALIYALYPAHPEAVVWISGRFDLLAQTFFLLSLILWIEGRKRGDSRWMMSSALAYLISLFAKETIIAGVVTFPLIDWLFYREFNKAADSARPNQWLSWLIVQAGVVAILIGARLWLFGSFVGDAGWTRGMAFTGLTFARLMNSFWQDLIMLFTPVNRGLFGQLVIAAVAALSLAGFISGAYAAAKSARVGDYLPIKIFAIALIWTLSILCPTLPLAPVRESLEGSRYLYTPALGLAVIAGLGFYNFRIGKYRLLVPALILCLVLGAESGILWRHNRLWLDTYATASRVESVMLDNTKDICDGATLVVVNLPWIRNGVYFAPNGYNFYLEWVYHCRHLRLIYIRKDPSQIDHWWCDLKSKGNMYKGFVWDDGNEVLKPLMDE